MADKKIEKALYGPSTTEVALGAVLGLFAGLLVACVYLVFKPVEQVRVMPEGDKLVRGTVYYIPGSESSAKSRSWSGKEKSFIAGQSVELVEDELNSWASSTFPATPAPKPGAEAAAADTGIFQPGTPNFHIADDQLRIGFKCVLNWYGMTHEVFVITSGTFKRSGDGFVFAPAKVYLGSCPVHLLPMLPGTLVSHLLGKKQPSDDLLSAWAKVADISIEDGKIKLTTQ